jgi:hypothetical protein
MRKLLSTQRHLRASDTSYLDAWKNVRDRAVALGARAWIFRAERDMRLYVEFIEWKASAEGGSPLDDAQLQTLLRALDELAPGEPQLWREPE